MWNFLLLQSQSISSLSLLGCLLLQLGSLCISRNKKLKWIKTIYFICSLKISTGIDARNHFIEPLIFMTNGSMNETTAWSLKWCMVTSATTQTNVLTVVRFGEGGGGKTNVNILDMCRKDVLPALEFSLSFRFPSVNEAEVYYSTNIDCFKNPCNVLTSVSLHRWKINHKKLHNKKNSLLFALRNLYTGNHKHHSYWALSHAPFWTACVRREGTTNMFLWYSACLCKRSTQENQDFTYLCSTQVSEENKDWMKTLKCM